MHHKWDTYYLRDCLLVLMLLPLVLPIFLILIPLLYFSQAKVFFHQRRPGYKEKIFLLHKFSTLRDIKAGEKEEENQQARLTYWGKYLRKFSLDELPQLWNVLKGEMAIVGPRPLLEEYLPLYSETERLRHSVRPGITGWAQVNGRNAISFKEKFALDLFYVQNRSHLLDLKILYLSFAALFRTQEVYANAQTTAELYNGEN